MANVTIGGRELAVLEETLGFERKKLLPWKKRHAAALEKLTTATDPDAVFEAKVEMNGVMVEGFLLYVGDNEEVGRDWLEDHLPSNPAKLKELLDQVLKAAGREQVAQGEAESR